MPRFYVKNKEEKWNIYSTIVDDILYDNWLTFNQLEEAVINEIIMDKKEDLKSLLTNNPRLNVMSYEDCLEKLKIYNNASYKKEMEEGK